MMFWGTVVGSAVVSLVLGLFLGFMPLKNDEMTEQQQKYSQLVGLLAFALLVGLIILHQNEASWVLIAGLVIGFVIGKIPPIRHHFSTRFALFALTPKESRGSRRNQQTPRREGTKQSTQRRR
ncbi:MAG: hypothetical protein ABF780_00900 [Bifidobacterium aquikefiri]|uniref:Uncharacterized protein n=2 Tax=Bifidobacterium aquikefiri TaxID=1653207 RepID=A0A261G9J6_9BIFI|nr:hypothetical protein [Bifidobacterium aquikefiri]OZG67913.1 hypothetical protein BAQU_0558 [Bifidobacterium aquikefiri]